MHHTSDGAALADELLVAIRAAVGQRIRELREARGLSQRAASGDVFMHQSDWSRIERGVVDPRLSTLVRIHYALGVDGVEALFGPLPSHHLLEQQQRAVSKPKTPR